MENKIIKHYRTTNNGLERPKMLTERPIQISERPIPIKNGRAVCKNGRAVCKNGRTLCKNGRAKVILTEYISIIHKNYEQEYVYKSIAYFIRILSITLSFR